MRQLHGHKCADADNPIRIEVDNKTYEGNRYLVSWVDGCNVVGDIGPGITNEVLLAILLDRLHLAQAGPGKCIEYGLAIDRLESALADLHKRTRELLGRQLAKGKPGGIEMQWYSKDAKAP